MTENTATTTKHGKKRIKERVGVGGKSADRQASLALERGLTHSDCKNRLLKWVNSRVLKGKKSHHAYNNIRIYNSKLFIFDGEQDILITVIAVPNNLLPLVNKLSKAKKESMIHD